MAKFRLTDAKQIYDLYRDYVKHEDELINRRLSWNLTLQGFLFAAYGVSFQVLSNTTADPAIRVHLRLLPCVFAVVGCLVATLVLMSILAAQSSIDGLKIRWRSPSSHIEDNVLEMLPELTGAGQHFANYWGKLSQVGIPNVIIIAWVGLFWIGVTAKV